MSALLPLLLLATASPPDTAVIPSYFNMTFTNMVVSTLGTGCLPELISAGKERFTGEEIELQLTPAVLPGLSLSGGFAHHDPRFVSFTFVTPEGEVEDESGKRLELTAQEMFSARVGYTSAAGIGAFAALWHQGTRPVDRDNAVFLEPYTEYDAGVYYDVGRFRVNVTGRNLSDDRHVAAESDLGDLEFLSGPAAPDRRRGDGELLGNA